MPYRDAHVSSSTSKMGGPHNVSTVFAGQGILNPTRDGTPIDEIHAIFPYVL